MENMKGLQVQRLLGVGGDPVAIDRCELHQRFDEQFRISGIANRRADELETVGVAQRAECADAPIGMPVRPSSSKIDCPWWMKLVAGSSEIRP